MKHKLEKAYACRLCLSCGGAVFVRLVGAERPVAIHRESRELTGRPLTPVSVAGRQYRRAAIGTAAAVGTAAAIGATAPYYTSAGYYAGGPDHSGTVRGARAAYYGGIPSAVATPDGNQPHYAVRAYYTGGLGTTTVGGLITRHVMTSSAPLVPWSSLTTASCTSVSKRRRDTSRRFKRRPPRPACATMKHVSAKKRGTN